MKHKVVRILYYDVQSFDHFLCKVKNPSQTDYDKAHIFLTSRQAKMFGLWKKARHSKIRITIEEL